MSVDPAKAVLFIEGKQVRYKQGGMNGIIKTFNSEPTSAVFQGDDVIVNLDNGQIRRIIGPLYNVDESVATVNRQKNRSLAKQSIKNYSSDTFSSTFSEPTSLKLGNINIIKLFIGLGLIVFVWMFYYTIDVIKSIYWLAPKKAWNWFRNFIRD